MIVLDTNVVSELMRNEPDERVVEWVDHYPADDVFVTAVTAAELLYGVERLPDGRRKSSLMVKVAELLAEDFQGQVLPFGIAAAAHYAQISAARERGGRPITMVDAQIAAVCLHHNAHLATRNTKDFIDTGVRVLNPWDDTESLST
ncbi:type II toxin-antitoxin system VapC family toxin [Actinokineospora xionganensis]|uniref:Ribonuclease VapC n=1 Tax=Actinokineospora xionganensis TaxID=2684470 RepID=A0ABR7L9B9_9PSEU|nr:type II toxin-antitoxin system VapC family toxin [Actinokineospora xionganensis]MBC6449300.1 type II toxin-antitoxin system VapC family toxin [Actinokineospora xionganensis]